MISEELSELDLDEYWSDDEPTVRHRGRWLAWSETGTRSASTYFEIPPGCHIGRHTHDAEEVVVVFEGTGTAVVGDEARDFRAPHLAVAPAGEPHDFVNGGEEPLRAVGFFPLASVSTTFAVELQPSGSKETGTPDRT